MCYIFNDAEKKGIEQGFKQGVEQGIEQGTFLTLMSLAQKGEISHTAAAEQMNISKEEFESKIRDFSNNN